MLKTNEINAIKANSWNKKKIHENSWNKKN